MGKSHSKCFCWLLGGICCEYDKSDKSDTICCSNICGNKNKCATCLVCGLTSLETSKNCTECECKTCCVLCQCEHTKKNNTSNCSCGKILVCLRCYEHCISRCSVQVYGDTKKRPCCSLIFESFVLGQSILDINNPYHYENNACAIRKYCIFCMCERFTDDEIKSLQNIDITKEQAIEINKTSILRAQNNEICLCCYSEIKIDNNYNKISWYVCGKKCCSKRLQNEMANYNIDSLKYADIDQLLLRNKQKRDAILNRTRTNFVLAEPPQNIYNKIEQEEFPVTITVHFPKYP